MSHFFVKDKKFYRVLFLIASPIILQNMITIGVNMMDTMMLGNYGEIQLSASSLANDFINIFQILCMGMGCGAAVLTAQYWGSKDITNLKKAVTIMLRIGFVIATIFTFVTVFFSAKIMNIYTNDADVIEKGILYFSYSIPTYYLMGISLTLTQVLRSIRKVKLPLTASIISFVVNIFFNWVFIFGHLGMPEMQIAGAALGTLIARIVETLIIGSYFFYFNSDVGYRLSDIKMKCGDLLSKYLNYCAPVIASDFLLALGNTAVSIIIGHIGTLYVAAYSIIAVIQRLCTVFTSGLGAASHTVTGNRIGEGETEKAYHEAVTMISISVLLGLFAAFLMLFFGPSILSIYDITAETTSIAMQMLQAMAIMIVFQAMQSVLTKGVLRGGGDTKFCLCIDAVFLWIISIPLGCLTGLVLHLSPFIICISLKLDWVVKSILGCIRVKSKKWLKIV